MDRKLIRRLLSPLLAVLPFLAASASGSVASAEVLLLRTGAILEGRLIEEQNHIRLVQPDGQVTLRRRDVVVVKASLKEVYQWLRDQQMAGAPMAEEHLGLAEWCIRHELWAEASRELLEARNLSPKSERVALVERRLMLMSQQATSVNANVAAPNVIKPPAQKSSRLAEETSLPSLPINGVEFFTRRVQPLLVNNCTNGGCHCGNNAGSFALDRRILYGYADARSTQANLRSVLSAIDLENPEASQLLSAARGPHYGVTPLSGHRRADWLERLEEWTHSVAQSNGWSPQIEEPLPEVTQPSKGVQLATHEAPIKDESDLAESLAPARVVRGGVVQTVKPRDQFDPEIFNRRYRRPEDDLPAP